LKERRKKEINEYNMKTFSNPSIGIHGNELPKFKENFEEHWKIKKDWKANPHFKTQTDLLGTREFRKKLEVTEKVGIENREIILKKSLSKHEVCEKPNKIDLGVKYQPLLNEQLEGTLGSKHDYRLSTIFGYFLKSKSSSNQQTFEPVVQSRREVKRETFNLNNPITEAVTPKTSTGFTLKTKTLIKKQGTSQRLLRSRGFLA
jgi:hypothetical protein